MRALEPVAFAIRLEVQLCFVTRAAVFAVVEIDFEGVGEEREDADKEGRETHFDLLLWGGEVVSRGVVVMGRCAHLEGSN